MKKLLLAICLAASCLAAKQTLAKTPTSTPYYMNLIAAKCDDMCLYELLYDGAYLSFLARFSSEDERLYNIYSKLSNGLDYISLPARARLSSVNIAVVLPENSLKSYSSNIAAPVLAYLIHQNTDAKMKVFYTGTERLNAQLIEDLRAYNLIITGFHTQALAELAASLPGAHIYSPLASAEDFANAPTNLYFGSIDYNEQIAKLSSIATAKVGVFSDTSVLSARLSSAVSANKQVIFSRQIAPQNYNVTAALSGAGVLSAQSVFFNLPLVKTTLIATQLHALNVSARNFLSTQINYHPMFLNLAQQNERDKFYFASIISSVGDNIEYINEMLGQKLAYNWIVYSTSAGLDNLYNKLYQNTGERLFSDSFEGRKMNFHTKIMSAKNSKFSEVK